MRPFRFPLIFASIALFAPSVAYAHTGVNHLFGFQHGVGHPIGGLDHLLAMVAVGIWAAQLGGRALWIVPLTFVFVTGIGGVIGMTGIPFLFVEQGIVLSVLLFGVLIAAAFRFSPAIGAITAGVFALFHGYAHGAEIPAIASGIAYGVGFVMTTALLHVAGIGFGLFFERKGSAQVVRFAGAGIALCGVFLFFR